mgnify:CR=1 FL=1
MHTFLTYILADGTEVSTYAKALASGQKFIKRFKSYEYPDSINPLIIPDRTPDYIEDIIFD